MLETKTTDIIWLLIRCPMTAEMIFRASRNFRILYRNLGNLRNDLKSLHGKGLLGRQPIPSDGKGQKEFLYFPARTVRRLPEFADMGLPEATFRGFSGPRWHAEATSEFISHFERSAGEIKPRVRILASVRDGYFRASPDIAEEKGGRTTALIPDHTLVAEVDGETCLLFVEVFNSPALHSPLSPQSVGRSVRFRMAKYKAFKTEFRGHPVIRDLELQLGCRFQGFRVLVVAAKGEAQKASLLSLARADGYKTMFYFASLDGVRSANIFTDPVWSLPKGSDCGIMNS